MSRKELSKELLSEIENDLSVGKRSAMYFKDENAHRRNATKDIASVVRPPFVRDAEKILHSAYYNRYADKTQVFSFYRNDDITRRGLHVQVVSRVARTIGRVLGLNLDLIEAIALGHDIGHTPFGHAGEKFLSSILHERTGQYFSHNIHSVRVFDRIFHYNLTLETLNGIAAHNGEVEARRYSAKPMTEFSEFDAAVDACYADKENNLRFAPSTMEGCLVRICDIIAYLGKDRQDAIRAGIVSSDEAFSDSGIGKYNAEIIHNIQMDLIENSYGKDAISMSDECFAALSAAKKDNYEKIYFDKRVQKRLSEEIEPMMREMYDRLLSDLCAGDESSVIFRHHIHLVESDYSNRNSRRLYREEPKDMIVSDFIASMTDDYFLDLYDHLFQKNSVHPKFFGYFD